MSGLAKAWPILSFYCTLLNLSTRDDYEEVGGAWQLFACFDRLILSLKLTRFLLLLRRVGPFFFFFFSLNCIFILFVPDRCNTTPYSKPETLPPLSFHPLFLVSLLCFDQP